MGDMEGTLSLTRSEIEKGLQRLPALSSTVTQLIELTQRDDADAGQVSQTVAQDPVLSARLLRVANSPFFGLAGEISSLNQACMVLGMSTVRNLAIAVGMKNSLSGENQSEEQASLWRKATEKAVAAEALARRCRQSSETAFTAGMLHDLGKMVMVACFVDAMQATHAYQDSNNCSLDEAERAVFGMTHREIGGMLAKLWCLPSLIHQVVAGVDVSENGEPKPVVDIVLLSGVIVDLKELDSPEAVLEQLPEASVKRLGLDSEKLEKWLGDIIAGQALVDMLA